MINSQCTTYIQRIEGSEGNEMSEELQLLGKRYLRMLNDPNLSFIDLEELGLCVYEEMKKYAEKYRKKLDQNNKKRREARLKQSENQKVNINEEQLKQIVSESVKRVLKEGLFDMFRRGPSAEEMEQQRLHNYYENRIISLMKKAAMSYEVHNGDANYVTMLQTAKEAYDKGVIQEYEFSNWFEKYYYEPRTRLLNQNNWLLRKGEKYPQDYWPGLENIG